MTTEVRVTNERTGGQKGSKPARFDLIPVHPLWEVAELYGRGAEKYEPRNWQRGYDWSLSFAAMMRHAWLFWNGEDRDTETGCHHLASVVFHAFAMMEFGRTHPEMDDRPCWGEHAVEGIVTTDRPLTDAEAEALRARLIEICADHRRQIGRESPDA